MKYEIRIDKWHCVIDSNKHKFGTLVSKIQTHYFVGNKIETNLHKDLLKYTIMLYNL